MEPNLSFGVLYFKPNLGEGVQNKSSCLGPTYVGLSLATRFVVLLEFSRLELLIDFGRLSFNGVIGGSLKKPFVMKGFLISNVER